MRAGAKPRKIQEIERRVFPSERPAFLVTPEFKTQNVTIFNLNCDDFSLSPLNCISQLFIFIETKREREETQQYIKEIVQFYRIITIVTVENVMFHYDIDLIK